MYTLVCGFVSNTRSVALYLVSQATPEVLLAKLNKKTPTLGVSVSLPERKRGFVGFSNNLQRIVGEVGTLRKWYAIFFF